MESFTIGPAGRPCQGKGAQDALAEIKEIRAVISMRSKMSFAMRRSMTEKKRNTGRCELPLLSSREKERIVLSEGRPGKVLLPGVLDCESPITG